MLVYVFPFQNYCCVIAFPHFNLLNLSQEADRKKVLQECVTLEICLFLPPSPEIHTYILGDRSLLSQIIQLVYMFHALKMNTMHIQNYICIKIEEMS